MHVCVSEREKDGLRVMMFSLVNVAIRKQISILPMFSSFAMISLSPYDLSVLSFHLSFQHESISLVLLLSFCACSTPPPPHCCSPPSLITL